MTKLDQNWVKTIRGAADTAHGALETLVLEVMRLEELGDALEKDNARMRKALDDVYNHNEAARAAVIQHYGIHHRPDPA